MCFGRSMYRSRKTAALPKAARASLRAETSPSTSSRWLRATRMPRPPPPALALMMIGYPCDLAKTSASSSWRIGSAVPGTMGTPAAAAALRPATLSPRRRCISAVGPTKTIPAAPQASANSAFSERNP